MTRVGIIGVGGFAANHHAVVKGLEERGVCRLVCACDPNATMLEGAAKTLDFTRRGVAVYADYHEMLAAHKHELDVVTVPTPIPLHAEMHRACVESGVACYLEKPPTLDPDELEAMIAVDAQAKHDTFVAFNFIGEPERRVLKARVLRGEFGKLRRVSFTGYWSRGASYFTRNNWAGRLFSGDGRLLLDSCVGNAMAHFVHNVLYWAGTVSIGDFAAARQVEAELYRAFPIETFDTCFIRAVCGDAVEVRIAATHTGTDDYWHEERVECERGAIVYRTGHDYRVYDAEWNETERGAELPEVLLTENLTAYFDYVRGGAARPATRLIDARPFVQLNALAYVAADGITEFDAAAVCDSGDCKLVDGVKEACAAFVASGAFPSAQGFAWARSGTTATPSDLGQLRGVAEGLLRR